MGIQNMKNARQEDRRKFVISVVKILLLIAFAVGLPLYIYFAHHDIILQFRSIEDVTNYISGYEEESALVYMLLQTMQIVIAFLPGQVFQIAAGYMFEFWGALLYSLIGIVAGTLISFYLTRLLSRDFIEIFFGKEKMDTYIERLNSPKSYAIVFFIYLIPGLPKDMVSYAAGASSIDFKRFLGLSLLGRLPGLIGSILIGVWMDDKAYYPAIILFAAALVICVLCVIFRKQIQNLVYNIKTKVKK